MLIIRSVNCTHEFSHITKEIQASEKLMNTAKYSYELQEYIIAHFTLTKLIKTKKYN